VELLLLLPISSSAKMLVSIRAQVVQIKDFERRPGISLRREVALAEKTALHSEL
jgi:hypothetical protein